MRPRGHFLFASAMFLVSCTGVFEDPFVSQRAGKHVFVQASLVNKMPLTESENSVKVKTHLIQFSESVDMPSFERMFKIFSESIIICLSSAIQHSSQRCPPPKKY